MRNLFLSAAFAVMVVGTTNAQQPKYVGGDISTLARYEERGAKFLKHDGTAISSPLQFFKDEGMNAMRIRLFVNPENASTGDKGQGVFQDLEYVKAIGKRIKDMGLSFMLDFHYSDSWADPAKQWTPAAWLSLTDEQLYNKIYEYTKDVLQQLVAVGATPDFIQTGNEISYGMLWGASTGSPKKCTSGSDANWERFTTLLKQAGKACREVCPQAMIILHTERTGQTGVLEDFYNRMKANSVDYDIIGLSYYPYWHGNMTTLDTALKALEKNFTDKKIMIVETGYYHHWQPDNVTNNYSSIWPISDAGQDKFANDLITVLNEHHDSVIGLYWWAMDCNEYGIDWQNAVLKDWYNAGLFDNQTGRATLALSSLKDFLEGYSSVKGIAGEISGNCPIHTLSGIKISCKRKGLPKGVCIKDGRKVLIK